VVHNETATGVTSRIAEVRRAIDAAKHPALLLVDTISSLASIDYRHDEWGVDVTVGGSQKGLMLPPGLSFNALSARRWPPRRREAAAQLLGLGRNDRQQQGWLFPYTPATNLLYGLRESLKMLLEEEEGLDNVFARHQRHAEATRRGAGLGAGGAGQNPAEYSASLTAVLMPAGHDADKVRKIILENFDMSPGTGLGKLAGKVFRIGHLGDFNDLTLLGTLAGCEMGLELAGAPIKRAGVSAAMEYLAEWRRSPASQSKMRAA
jgi:alanine-glyoxylate transaminase/serine-glyoxylate transaminase/serine-pyruvate transaminase